ncbi:hypothetical protein FE257_003866 [Aspergillus nanangensis]|uniref:Uncharacterized protein n=1 Tax=Aspergillus nanangensis TaxID=2582783 RepID=A0AAD4CB41_ASPNN|nr:hypothetical protein FE257_003866 [Aspergillus nanangensis]
MASHLVNFILAIRRPHPGALLSKVDSCGFSCMVALGKDGQSNTTGNQGAEATSSTSSQAIDAQGESVEYYRTFLERLLHLVCNGDQATVSQLIAVIRSGASHERILSAISQVQELHDRLNPDGSTRRQSES